LLLIVCCFGIIALVLGVCFVRGQNQKSITMTKERPSTSLAAVMSRSSVPGFTHNVHTRSTLNAVDSESPQYLTSMSPSSKSVRPPNPNPSIMADHHQNLTQRIVSSDGVTHHLVPVVDEHCSSSSASSPSCDPGPPVVAMAPIEKVERRQSFTFPPPNTAWQSAASKDKLQQLVVHSGLMTASNTPNMAMNAHVRAHSQSLSLSVESVPCQMQFQTPAQSPQPIAYQRPPTAHLQQMMQIMAASRPPSLSSFVVATMDQRDRERLNSREEAAECESRSSQTSLKPPESLVSISESDRDVCDSTANIER